MALITAQVASAAFQPDDKVSFLLDQLDTAIQYAMSRTKRVLFPLSIVERDEVVAEFKNRVRAAGYKICHYDMTDDGDYYEITWE